MPVSHHKVSRLEGFSDAVFAIALHAWNGYRQGAAERALRPQADA